MSRFNVQCGEFTVVYGFDRPLSEYFMSIEGPSQNMREFISEHGLDYWYELSGTHIGAHLVGTLSYPEVYGSASNWLSSADKFGVKQCIPEHHLQTVEMDLPI